jgi:hypothetical protein
MNAHGAETNLVSIVTDNFESYPNNRAFKKAWPGGSGSLKTNVPGGGNAIFHNGVRYHFQHVPVSAPTATNDILLSADFYDFATNSERRVTVCLTNDSGDTLAIGLVGANSYVARGLGFLAKTNWLAFERGQPPVKGWHHFEALLSASNVVFSLDLHADGKIDRQIRFPIVGPAPAFTTIAIGGFTSGRGWRAPVLVDNVRVDSVPIAAASLIARKISFYSDKAFFAVAAAAVTNIASSPQTTPVPHISNAVAEAKGVEEQTASSTNDIAKPATPAIQTPIMAAEPAIIPGAPPESSSQLNHALWFIGIALMVILALLAYMVSVLRRATHPASRSAVGAIAVRPLLGDGESSTKVSAATDEWRERAIRAEVLAAKQAQILQEKVGPELVEFAKDTLVQGLYQQRTSLIETQARAQEALNDLEKKLIEMDLPLRERVKAYEKRIAELEKDLGSRSDEMRELTRATLALMKKRMEDAREGSGQKFN